MCPRMWVLQCCARLTGTQGVRRHCAGATLGAFRWRRSVRRAGAPVAAARHNCNRVPHRPQSSKSRAQHLIGFIRRIKGLVCSDAYIIQPAAPCKIKLGDNGAVWPAAATLVDMQLSMRSLSAAGTRASTAGRRCRPAAAVPTPAQRSLARQSSVVMDPRGIQIQVRCARNCKSRSSVVRKDHLTAARRHKPQALACIFCTGPSGGKVDRQGSGELHTPGSAATLCASSPRAAAAARCRPPRAAARHLDACCVLVTCGHRPPDPCVTRAITTP